MCQLPSYSHLALPLGKTRSRIQMGKKACGQPSLLKAEHRRVLFWQQDIQRHGTELT